MDNALFTSHLQSLLRWRHGKVRGTGEIDTQYPLIITTDRISYRGVVLPTAIYGMGMSQTSL